MDAAAFREFCCSFQEYLMLNEDKNWPLESTEEFMIRHAYILARHIEKAVERLQQRGVLEEFLDVALTDDQKKSRPFIRDCLINPSRLILKKIINSKTSPKQVEVGVKIYLEMYSEEMLQTSLTNYFVETASKETLIRNLTTELTEGQLTLFQTKVLLSELNSCSNPTEVVKNLLDKPKLFSLEVVIISLLNEEPKYANEVRCIEAAVEQKMLSKQLADKKFWKCFFQMRHKYLRRLCRKYQNLFKHVCTVLFDVAKLLKENMSMEYFYVKMTLRTLKYAVFALCQHRETKYKFIAAALEQSGDPDYWMTLLVKSVPSVKYALTQ